MPRMGQTSSAYKALSARADFCKLWSGLSVNPVSFQTLERSLRKPRELRNPCLAWDRGLPLTSTLLPGRDPSGVDSRVSSWLSSTILMLTGNLRGNYHSVHSPAFVCVFVFQLSSSSVDVHATAMYALVIPCTHAPTHTHKATHARTRRGMRERLFRMLADKASTRDTPQSH